MYIFCHILLSHSVAAHDFILLQCDTGGALVGLEVMGWEPLRP